MVFGSQGLQVGKWYLLWGLKSINRTYFGLFGAPGYWSFLKDRKLKYEKKQDEVIQAARKRPGADMHVVEEPCHASCRSRQFHCTKLLKAAGEFLGVGSR